MTHVTDRLIARHAIISDQIDQDELRVIVSMLELVLPVHNGAVVEFGCYIGTTSLFVRRLLDSYNDNREFHVYDSFVGLPAKSAKDSSPAGEQFVIGELASSKKQFLLQFKKANLGPPIVHKAWFSDLSRADIPPSIVFAFLDGDYYQSVADSLRLIENSLSPGSVVVVDDYVNEALPGVAKAVNEWMSGKKHRMSVVSSLAVIHCK